MLKNESQKLFTEFPEIGTKEWEDIILKDLKGQDYNKKLIWNSPEGIAINPYYRKEDVKGIDYPVDLRMNLINNSWEIRHFIQESNPVKANREALQFISEGVNSIGFDASEIANKEKMGLLLKDIDLEAVSISFAYSRCNRFMRGLLCEYLTEKNINMTKVRGFFDHDPYSYPLLNGDFPDNPKNIRRKLYELLDTTSTFLPNFRAINVNGSIFHNAGANAVQEIAYSLALANEYLVMLTDQDLKVEKITPLIQVTLSAGSNYFVEIAKLRAIRLLWAKMLEGYKPKCKDALKLHLHVISSEWNKSIYDPFTNVLRHTTEAMSAIIGGTDQLTILPFDLHYKKSDDFSKRLAKNIQILLKEESYLDKVRDPASGSYYIEVLTDKIAYKSWELFKSVEEKGGFLSCIHKGTIQTAIHESCLQRETMVMNRKESILGLNLFPNVEEKIGDEIIVFPEKEDVTENTPYKTLPQNRKAIIFEELRLKTETYAKMSGHTPVFFMLPIGNPGMASARQIFSRNFFGVAGFKIVENARFSDVKTAVKQAVKLGTDVIVICSSDEEYRDIAPLVCAEVKDMTKKIRIVVAGNPTEIIEELKASGVDDFIHIKSELMSTLTQYQKLFGII